MKHMEYQKQISLLLDGVLDSPSQRKLLDHLSECADCVRVYEDMVSLNDSLADRKIVFGRSCSRRQSKDSNFP